MRYIELRKPIKTEFTGATVTTIMVAKYANDGSLAWCSLKLVRPGSNNCLKAALG